VPLLAPTLHGADCEVRDDLDLLCHSPLLGTVDIYVALVVVYRPREGGDCETAAEERSDRKHA
jgi:hypothetical protein